MIIRDYSSRTNRWFCKMEGRESPLKVLQEKTTIIDWCKLHLRQACLWKKLEDSPTEAFPETGSVAITSQLGGISSGILHGWMRRVRQLIWALVFLCFKGVIGFVIHSESFICKNVTWDNGIGGCKNRLLHRFLIEFNPKKGKFYDWRSKKKVNAVISGLWHCLSKKFPLLRFEQYTFKASTPLVFPGNIFYGFLFSLSFLQETSYSYNSELKFAYI